MKHENPLRVYTSVRGLPRRLPDYCHVNCRILNVLCSFVATTAAQIIEAVDLTADPCDDFFQYACGSWNKKHIIPEDKTSYNPFEKLNDQLQVILKSKPMPVCVNCVN